MVDTSNIKSLYVKYIDQLYAYALNLGFDEQTAMDAIHDLFYKLCVNNVFLEKIANVRFYLFKALKNKLVDMRRTKRDYLDISSSQGEEMFEQKLFRLKVTVEDQLIQKEDREEIRRKVEKVLDKLTNRQREIIYLRYIQEYDYKEIAELMDISVEACRNLTSKALGKLRESSVWFPVILLILAESVEKGL